MGFHQNNQGNQIVTLDYDMNGPLMLGMLLSLMYLFATLFLGYNSHVHTFVLQYAKSTAKLLR